MLGSLKYSLLVFFSFTMDLFHRSKKYLRIRRKVKIQTRYPIKGLFFVLFPNKHLSTQKKHFYSKNEQLKHDIKIHLPEE